MTVPVGPVNTFKENEAAEMKRQLNIASRSLSEGKQHLIDKDKIIEEVIVHLNKIGALEQTYKQVCEELKTAEEARPQVEATITEKLAALHKARFEILAEEASARKKYKQFFAENPGIIEKKIHAWGMTEKLQRWFSSYEQEVKVAMIGLMAITAVTFSLAAIVMYKEAILAFAHAFVLLSEKAVLSLKGSPGTVALVSALFFSLFGYVLYATRPFNYSIHLKGGYVY